MTVPTPGVAPTFAALLGGDLPIAVTAFDGTRAGPPDPPATLDISSPTALQRMLSAPGELGLGRALVSGDLRIDGDLYAVLGLREGLDADEVLRRWPLVLGSPAPPDSAPRRGGCRRRRRRRRGCAAAATADAATPPRSRTTTTSATTSTGCSWVRR